MRQYDRAGPVSKLVSRGQQGLEVKRFGIGHGDSLEAILLCESRLAGRRGAPVGDGPPRS
jgi:hypothetical protein